MPGYHFDSELSEYVPRLPTVIDMTDVGRVRAQQLFDEEELDPAKPDVGWLDRTLPGSGEVKVRIYRPGGATTTLPAILQIHGGGFVVGGLDSSHRVAARMARAVRAVVVSVDYRLAPEHPYPAALDDCDAALAWLVDNAVQLDLDPERIAVAGESSGACLAAALALRARDRGKSPIRFQALDMPVLDDRLETHSMRMFTDTPIWTRSAAEQTWAMYLGGGDDGTHYAVPARAADLSGLPPAYVSTMEFDPLRDEGIAYALRLLQAGIQVELHTFPGTFHASSLLPHAAISKWAERDRHEALHRALHRVTAS